MYRSSSQHPTRPYPWRADEFQEAITRGEPLVGIPVFAVERLNMARVGLVDYGLIIDYKNITREFFKLVYSRSN